MDIAIENSRKNLFDDELLALGEGIPSHSMVTGQGIMQFINNILDLLVDGNMLCPHQGKTIVV